MVTARSMSPAGAGFPGPDLELPGGLLDKHLHSGDDGDSLGARHLQQMRFHRVVHHIEDNAGMDFLVLKRAIARVAHAHRSGVNDHIEGDFPEIGPLEGARFGLAGELLSFRGGAIQYPDFSAALFETEDGSARRAAGAEHENFRVLDREDAVPADESHRQYRY